MNIMWLKSRQKKVLFLSSAITSLDSSIDSYDYFASIASLLAIKLHKQFKKYDLVIKVPEGGNNYIDNQRGIINDILSHIKEYEVVILSPTNRDEIIKNVESILEKQICLITIDQGYPFKIPEYTKFLDDAYIRPYYVQADWFNGGRIAGESMIECLNGNKTPNIVLVKGNIGSKERVAGFKDMLQSKKYYPSYFYCEGNYCKTHARNAFESLFNEQISNVDIHGVFATNDEMALGVREFYIKYKGERKYIPKIIGFDGIKDLTILIQNNDDIVYDTVDVQVEQQIAQLIKIIEDKVIAKSNELKSEDLYVEHPCISFRKKLQQNHS